MSAPTVKETSGLPGYRELRGSRTALEAHPLCPPGLFEGYGTHWKASRTLRHAGRKHQVFALGRQFRLCIHRTDEERRAAWDRDREAQAVEFTGKRVQRRLAEVPRDAGQWRAQALQFLAMISGGVELTARGESTGSGGFALDAEAQDLVGIHLQAIRQAFETAPVVFDAQARRADLDGIMAPLRQAVPQVQTFVQQLQGGAA